MRVVCLDRLFFQDTCVRLGGFRSDEIVFIKNRAFEVHKLPVLVVFVIESNLLVHFGHLRIAVDIFSADIAHFIHVVVVILVVFLFEGLVGINEGVVLDLDGLVELLGPENVRIWSFVHELI